MDLFTDINVMNRALDAAVLKKSVISENISNVDTPNYKRKDVAFETVLREQVQKNGTKSIDLDKLVGQVYVDKQNYAYRLDGNNVDIDIEMAEEAKINLRYSALVERVNAQLSRYSTILQSLR